MTQVWNDIATESELAPLKWAEDLRLPELSREIQGVDFSSVDREIHVRRAEQEWLRLQADEDKFEATFCEETAFDQFQELHEQYVRNWGEPVAQGSVSDVLALKLQKQLFKRLSHDIQKPIFAQILGSEVGQLLVSPPTFAVNPADGVRYSHFLVELRTADRGDWITIDTVGALAKTCFPAFSYIEVPKGDAKFENARHTPSYSPAAFEESLNMIRKFQMQAEGVSVSKISSGILCQAHHALMGELRMYGIDSRGLEIHDLIFRANEEVVGARYVLPSEPSKIRTCGLSVVRTPTGVVLAEPKFT